MAYGSQIASAGNVTVAATGGDLNVLGSQISVQDVALSATHDLNLLSQVEQHTDSSHSSNASGGLGFSVGSGGIGFYAQAAVGKGQAHGNGTTHADTSVEASNTLSLTSGNDATIQGAQAAGNTVLATIGGNLNLASEQDTNDYASSQWQAQGQVVIGMGGSGSGSLSVSEANNHYASVTQMSGIGAGSGGFNIDVGGNTDLKGAVIASTAPAADNLLDTGSLTYSNLQNEAASSAESVSVSSRMNSGPTGFSGGIGVPQNSNSQSSTQAGIAQGTITVRDNSGQDLSGLRRDASLADANGLTNSFDPQKVAENQQVGMLAGQVGMTAAGDIGQYMQQRAVDNGDAAQAQAWGAGGAKEITLHSLVGAGTAALDGGGALQGALGAGASEAASNLQLAKNPTEQDVLNVGIGALVGGGVGASTALAGTVYNDQHHYADYQNELQACQQNPSASGCSTILAMQGTHSEPLTHPDASNSTGVIVNLDAFGQPVSYTLTNAQNQPVLIMQPSDYQNYLSTIDNNGASVYQFIGNNSPEYALQASNFVTDLGNGNLTQAGGNLVGMFTNGSYWRDMGVGVAGASEVYTSPITSTVASDVDLAGTSVDSMASQTASDASQALVNSTTDVGAGSAITNSTDNATTAVDITSPVASNGTANAATAPQLASDLALAQSKDSLIGTTLPGASSPVQVTADASINGQSFSDVNQTARPAGSVDSNQPTLISDMVEPGDPNGSYGDAHAEIGVIQQAYDAGLTQGQSMTIVVRGQDVCTYCRSDIIDMAEAAGLNQLTVVSGVDGSVSQWVRGRNKLEQIRLPQF